MLLCGAGFFQSKKQTLTLKTVLLLFQEKKPVVKSSFVQRRGCDCRTTLWSLAPGQGTATTPRGGNQESGQWHSSSVSQGCTQPPPEGLMGQEPLEAAGSCLQPGLKRHLQGTPSRGRGHLEHLIQHQGSQPMTAGTGWGGQDCCFQLIAEQWEIRGLQD